MLLRDSALSIRSLWRAWFFSTAQTLRAIILSISNPSCCWVLNLRTKIQGNLNEEGGEIQEEHKCRNWEQLNTTAEDTSCYQKQCCSDLQKIPYRIVRVTEEVSATCKREKSKAKKTEQIMKLQFWAFQFVIIIIIYGFLCNFNVQMDNQHCYKQKKFIASI